MKKCPLYTVSPMVRILNIPAEGLEHGGSAARAPSGRVRILNIPAEGLEL